jgi:hypothetical protein
LHVRRCSNQCRFLNFSRSKNEMDLATRRFIREIEGENADIAKYRDPDGSPHQDMVGRSAAAGAPFTGLSAA